MQLSHPADDDFLGLLINIHCKGGILSLKFSQGFLEFRSSVLFGWFHSEAHDRLRNKHTLWFYDVRHIAFSECLPSWAIHSKYRKYISCLNLIDFLHFTCMHFNHSTYLHFLSNCIIPYKGSFLELSLINTNVGKLSKLWFLKFEDITYKRFVFVVFKHNLFFNFLFGFGILFDQKSTILFFRRRRKVFDDSIKCELDSFVFIGRSHIDWDEFSF